LLLEAVVPPPELAGLPMVILGALGKVAPVMKPRL